MIRKWLAANGILALTAALLATAAAAPAWGRAQDQQQAAKTPYTIPEYNAYETAAGQVNPQAQIAGCDDFVSKFPNSSLMPLIDELYFTDYNKLKNYPKLIEYTDKFLAIPDDKFKVLGLQPAAVTGKRLTALYLRALAFNSSFNEKDANAQDELTKAHAAALEGLKVLGEVAKPANVSDEQFEQSKKPARLYFESTAALTSFDLKNYQDAIDGYQKELTDSPNDAVAYYRIGVSYLQLAAKQAPPATPAATTPPGGTGTTTPATPATPQDPAAVQKLTDLYMNGFWALARSIALKGPGEAQVQSYLHVQMFNYEQPACGSLLDQQMNELIQLATNSPTRPATYSIPSAADLSKILQASNLLSILSDLQGGGDKATQTWLAVCGQEIPDVTGKIISLTPGADNVDFQVFTAATGEEIQAGTTPNLDVIVHTAPPANPGPNASQIPVQPEVSRLKKGDPIKFTGTLVSYDAQPFLVHFDKAKVDPTFIPAEKPTPARRRPGRPGGRGRGRG